VSKASHYYTVCFGDRRKQALSQSLHEPQPELLVEIGVWGGGAKADDEELFTGDDVELAVQRS
jgi:hypothetical protein